MDGPYELTAEKDINPAGIQCVQRRRHTQPHQDHQGEKEKDHRQISEFLQYVVALGRLACGMSKAQMIKDRSAYGAPILPRGNKIAVQMPAQNGVGHKGDTVYNEQPGEKEMPAPGHSKLLQAG